jgi:hypothetical protein
MELKKAVIEEAGVHKIVGDLFRRKPPGLRFNETEAVVISARAEDGEIVTTTFYLCLKPDGTFDEQSMGSDASQARRHRLANFIRYYGIAEDISIYNLRDRIADWKGRAVDVIPSEKGKIIYSP